MPSGGAVDPIPRDRLMVMLMGLHQLAQVDADLTLSPFVFDESLFATINGMLDDSRLGRFAPQATGTAAGRQSIGDVIAAVDLLHQRLTSRPELAEQLEPYYDLIATASAVAAATVTAEPLTVELDPARHLPLLRRVYIETEDGQPDLILVGAAGDIKIPGQHPVLQRLVIRYREGQLYPTLQLPYLSKTEQEPRPVGTKERLQKATPRFDLTIFTHRELPLAYVRTYFMEDPAIDITGRRLRLKLATRPGNRLLCTSISDLTIDGDRADEPYGKELARCVRVVSAAA